MNNLVAFSTFISCNHHLYPVLKNFCHSKINAHLFSFSNYGDFSHAAVSSSFLLPVYFTTPRLPLGFHRNSPSVLFSSSMCWSGLDAITNRPWQKGNSLNSSFPFLASPSPRPQVLITSVWWKMGPAPVHIPANGKGKEQKQRASVFLLSKFHFHLHSINEELVNWLCPTVN